MYRHVLFCLLTLFVLSVNSQTINVHGKVSNQAGNPVAGAIVTLVNQDLMDTTGEDGAYAITKNTAAVLSSPIPQTEKIILKKNVLEFSLTQPSEVKVDIFNVKGTLLKRTLLQDATAGIYRLNIAESIRAMNLLVIHASIGSRMMTFRYFPLFGDTYAMNTSVNSIAPIADRLVKITADADIDSLEFTADGYKKKVVKITSYDAEVDAVLEPTTGNDCEGCGNTDYPKSGKKSIDVDGMQRDYILKIPDNYDPGKKYKLIFCIHPWGGNMDQIAQQGYYGLERQANGTAIFVSPNGLEDNNQPRGWFNPDGRDIKFIKAMLDYFNANLCIDQERIFSTGFSFGGMMSFAIGCSFHDIFRAIAPMSGAFYSGCDESSQGPIAVWMAHGKTDGTVPLSDGKKARDYFLERNGCSNETVPVDPSPCVAYQGCEEDAPFIYCEFNGGHAPQSWAQEATWNFFSQF